MYVPGTTLLHPYFTLPKRRSTHRVFSKRLADTLGIVAVWASVAGVDIFPRTVTPCASAFSNMTNGHVLYFCKIQDLRDKSKDSKKVSILLHLIPTLLLFIFASGNSYLCIHRSSFGPCSFSIHDSSLLFFFRFLFLSTSLTAGLYRLP